MPGGCIHLHAAVAHPPVNLAAPADRLDRLRRADNEHASVTEPGLPDVDGEQPLGEVVDPAPKPFRFETGPDHGPVVGHPDDQRATTRGVGHARRLAGELSGCRLAPGHDRPKDPVPVSSPSVFLQVDVLAFDGGQVSPGSDSKLSTVSTSASTGSRPKVLSRRPFVFGQSHTFCHGFIMTLAAAGVLP